MTATPTPTPTPDIPPIEVPNELDPQQGLEAIFTLGIEVVVVAVAALGAFAAPAPFAYHARNPRDREQPRRSIAVLSCPEAHPGSACVSPDSRVPSP